MITQSLTVKKESHSDRFLKVQQNIYPIKYGFQEFCNQKVKNKKKMPDSIFSISFNTANPFKLCQKVHQLRFHEGFHLKHYLWQTIFGDSESKQKHGEKLTSTLASRCFPPVSSLPPVLRTFLFLWVFQDVKKNIYNSLKKTFQRQHNAC